MTDPSWEVWRKENGLTPEAIDCCGDCFDLGVETGLGYAADSGVDDDTETA
jgi:hypothetical protein